ncbi:MAG: CHAT domain-containing protein, partial [Anaerolineae bacterium]|nr:CHAT domain-containing protein [Anaerolineae bacterium]
TELVNDLEIRLFHLEDQGYPVELTLAGQQEFPRGYAPANLGDWLPGGDPVADGRELLNTLLSGDPALRSAWDKARALAPQCRLRLRLAPTAPELHMLPWELLCEDGVMLAANGDTPFSRYLSIALPWGGLVEERPIRVLVAISNPTDLDGYGLASLDVEQERHILQEALSVSTLSVTFLEPPITLEKLETALRKGYHICHYLGHGVYSARRQQAALYLQDAQGQTHVTPDDDLVGMLARLESGVKPQLVFLAACQSAVRSTADAFRGLGPKLVSIGVPAVMAMQDFVDVETAREFSRTFYTRLLEHGQVDKASNEARSTLLTTKRPDAAVPVLFMRLKSGQLWSAEADGRGKLLSAQAPKVFWKTVMRLIEDETCTPIIGPHVHGRWLPGMAEIAQQWAKEYDYPFGGHENLVHVAQYIDTTGGEDVSRRELARALRDAFKARLPEALRPRGKHRTLTQLVQAALQQDVDGGGDGAPSAASPPGWLRLSADDPNEPHRVLASLDLPLYLTTNCDNFMVEALAAQGKHPRRAFCRWHDGLPPDDIESYEPTADAPLVYHLFGSDEEMQSLVVSEDHYLDFLSNVLTKKDRIPYAIRGPLAESALLFVGYNLHDWEFRVVMRGLVKTLDFKFGYNHVAVQLEDVSETGEEAARSFLQQYFQKAQINVFWGNPAQFIAELREQWEAYNA